ncbi:MAG: uroporphyrinogen decarboxylase family protein [Treponema sp.]|jgi:uroporphyrinogen decarboxylase|nr:uroporphyrinogen decarboxylase family protein [Treponema sp.]
MKLTPKERFLRVVKGEDIDMLPVQCDFSAGGLQNFLLTRGINNVSDLELLPFFDNHVLYAYMNGATLRMKTKAFNGEKVIYDEWHCGWDTSQDLLYCTHPIAEWEDFEKYEFPDPNAPGYLDYAESLIKAGYAEERIVTSYHFCTLFERAYILRGMQNFLVDMLEEEELTCALLDKITAFHVELAKRYVKLGVNCGRTVDDYGSQTGMMMSPSTWRKLIKPKLARIHAVYRDAGIPVIHHSCGSIMPIIGDLIEIGVNVLNPVQPKALDVEKLSGEYGDKLAFFGGICNQEVLPFKGPEEIDAHVKYMVETLGRNGRYIIAPSNGVGKDVPLENVAAFYAAAQKYRRIK